MTRGLVLKATLRPKSLVLMSLIGLARLAWLNTLKEVSAEEEDDDGDEEDDGYSE